MLSRKNPCPGTPYITVHLNITEICDGPSSCPEVTEHYYISLVEMAKNGYSAWRFLCFRLKFQITTTNNFIFWFSNIQFVTKHAFNSLVKSIFGRLSFSIKDLPSYCVDCRNCNQNTHNFWTDYISDRKRFGLAGNLPSHWWFSVKYLESFKIC